MLHNTIKVLNAFALFIQALAFGQDTCPHRGGMDLQYCDAEKNLTADTPTDPKNLKTPNTLVFTFTPIKDPAVYDKISKPFTKYLAQCTNKKVFF